MEDMLILCKQRGQEFTLINGRATARGVFKAYVFFFAIWFSRISIRQVLA